MSKTFKTPVGLVNLSSNPSGTVAGTLYYNSTGNQITYYNGSGWVALSAGGYSTITLGSTALTSGSTVTTIAGLTLTTPTINGAALSGTFSGSAAFSPSATSGVAKTLTAISSQTADLFQVKDSTGAVRYGINPAGQTYLGNNIYYTSAAIVNITAISFTSTTATFTYSSPTQIVTVGEQIITQGTTPAGYSVSGASVISVATVTNGSSYSFTITNNTNTTATVFGSFIQTPLSSINMLSRRNVGLQINVPSNADTQTIPLLIRLNSGSASVDGLGNAVFTGLTLSSNINVASTGGSSNVGLKISGFSGQTADLVQVTNSSSTVLASITAAGILIEQQPTVTALVTSGAITLTVSQILTRIITQNQTVAATFTLPTGTFMDGAFSALFNNMSIDWSIINIGSTSGAVTMAVGTAHTYVGSTSIPITTSARFCSVRTAVATWVTYRTS